MGWVFWGLPGGLVSVGGALGVSTWRRTVIHGCLRTSPGALLSLVAQMVKHLTTMWEAWVRSLGREDPLEKAWQPTPVLLPGKSHGRRSLVGYSPWGRKESDTTEQFHFLSFFFLFLST